MNHDYDVCEFKCFIEKIGKGTFGSVYKCRNIRNNDQIVALKIIEIDHKDYNEYGISSSILREISMLKDLQHENIIALLDVFRYSPANDQIEKMCLVFEYMECDLKKYMIKNGMKGLMMKRCLHQLLRAVHFCHMNRVLHRDLKPQNVLLDQNGNIKLADFGLSRAFGIPVRQYTSGHQVVTLWYRAPELLLDSHYYSSPVDIWSVACIFAEMINHRAYDSDVREDVDIAYCTIPLFPGDSEIDQLYKIFRLLGTPTEETWPGVSDLPEFRNFFPNWPQKPLRSALPPTLSFAASHLLSMMLIYDPSHRISAKQALDHDYFKYAYDEDDADDDVEDDCDGVVVDNEYADGNGTTNNNRDNNLNNNNQDLINHNDDC